MSRVGRFPSALNMDADDRNSHRETVMVAYPYRIIAILLGIVGFFLGTRPELYPIPYLTTSEVGWIGLGLLILAVLLFFKRGRFDIEL